MSRHFLPVCLFLPLVLGCGGEALDVELGEVTGVVTLDGEPLSNVQVVFLPESGSSSSGVTDDQGNYELKYGGGHMGAVVGTHTVQIRELPSPDEAAPEDVDPLEAGDSHMAGPPEDFRTNKVPKKYSAGETGLTATVDPGENNVNFDLKSS